MVRGRPQTSISKLTVAAIVLGAICSGVHAREHNQTIWPGRTWGVATSPEAAGWSSENSPRQELMAIQFKLRQQ
jgi:hypothetical protein